MTPKSKPREASKVEEKKTYQVLGLSRAHKFSRERKKMERAGIWRVIGGDHADRPLIKVRSQEYWEVRFQVTEFFLQRPETLACEIPLGTLLDSLQGRIEEETYRRMQERSGGLSDKQVDQALGRKGSTDERHALRAGGAVCGYAAYRSALLDEVVAKVGAHQQANPHRLQEHWRQAVGSFANESGLEKIEQGVAYIRTVNRALGFELARRADLPKRLSELTGQAVKRLKVL